MQHMVDAERNTRHLPRGFVKFDSLLRNPQQSVERVFRSAGLEPPIFSDERAEELSQFLDRNMRHHQISDQEIDRQCAKVIADYYRLLCQVSEQDIATPEDLESMDELYSQFEDGQTLFYNRDVLVSRTLAEDRHKPSWYTAELKRIQRQFETDNIFREYRYIANTEYLYSVKTTEVPLLQARIKEREFRIEELDFHITELESQISLREIQISLRDARIKQLDDDFAQFVGSPPWRVYKKYQETIEKFLPEGTRRRALLQQCKRQVYAMLGADIVTPKHQVAEVIEPIEPSATTAETPIDQTSMQALDHPQITWPWEPLAFPQPENPVVSIIIPVFNNWHFTLKCLQSVYAHTEGSYEIIVVDNHSTDLTPRLLESMQGIRIITNETNEVFVNACNQAALTATGNYLLFLNNDTEVTPGWLGAMLAPFADTRTGIVGAKLIYPDGSLQEAGGIIWRDGTGCNYGHGDNPDLPQYSYQRAVDYCSGACLMLTRKLWEDVGGFDQRYAPAYYEDTDLCFAVRAKNYRVVFQPQALSGSQPPQICPEVAGGTRAKPCTKLGRPGQGQGEKWRQTYSHHRSPCSNV
jgi:hypothetical protein